MPIRPESRGTLAAYPQANVQPARFVLEPHGKQRAGQPRLKRRSMSLVCSDSGLTMVNGYMTMDDVPDDDRPHGGPGSQADIEELRKQFADDPWPIVGFLTTEHSTLVSLRAASIAESSSRVSALLAALSASLVALGFVAASTDGFGTGFYAMGAVAFALLTALGLMTFGRCLQTSIEDLREARRVERVRSTYLALAPGLRRILRPPYLEGRDAARRSAGMDARGKAQFFFSLVSLVGVVNVVVIGALVAFCAELLGAPPAVSIALAATCGLLAAIAQAAVQFRFFEAANSQAAVARETE